MPNGAHNSMPLTEYSANPIENPVEKSPASSLIPASFLLPNGHPDVRKNHILPVNYQLTIPSISA